MKRVIKKRNAQSEEYYLTYKNIGTETRPVWEHDGNYPTCCEYADDDETIGEQMFPEDEENVAF